MDIVSATDKKKNQDKLVPVPEKTVDKYNITDIPSLKEENKALVKDIRSDKYSTPQQIAMQRRMNRESVRDARDTNMVVSDANDRGIDLNKPYSFPVTDSYRKKLVDELGNHVSETIRPKLSTFVSSIPNPNYVEPPKINVDEEKRKARIQRAARWADALYAFGEGMQHRTADPNNFAFNRIQAKRDTNFNNFKAISEANKKTASDWEFNSRKETLDWIEKQLASETLSASEAKKYKLLYDQLAQQQKQHEDEMKLGNKRLDLEKERIDPTVARGTFGINGRQYDYDLKASDIPDLSSKAKADTEFLNEHPEFFIEYRVGDQVTENGKQPVTERKLNINDVDLALAYKNRFANKRIVPVSQIPLSKEAYQAEAKYNALNNSQQQPIESPEKAIDDFFSK